MRRSFLLVLLLSLGLVASCTVRGGGRGGGGDDDDDDDSAADDDDATGDDDDATGDDDDATGDDDDATGDDDDATGDDDDATGDDDDATGDDDDSTSTGALLTVDATISCGSAVQSTNVGEPNDVIGYVSCGGNPEGWDGGERVFSFSGTGDFVTADLSWSDSGQDLDLFVLEGPDSATDNCPGSSTGTTTNESVQWSSGSSTWYIVVDGWEVSEAAFTLEMSCGPE